MTRKATVVLASFGSTERHTLESLDRQSLPPSAFEVVLVDDRTDLRASERMRQLADNRPNFVVHTAEGVGHLGGRRNAGASVATGDYVVFLEDGPELGDEALDRLCQYADAQQADICLGKTSYPGTHPSSHALFAENRPRTDKDAGLIEELDAGKLYRRSFLQEHGLRYDDESDLVADPEFDLNAFARTGSISVLADYPAFTGAAVPASDDAGAYLRAVDRSDAPEELRDLVVLHRHRQSLDKLVRHLRRPRSDEDVNQTLATVGAVVNEHVAEDADSRLDTARGELSRAVRAGDLAEVLRVGRQLGNRRFDVQGSGAHWDQGTLQVRFRLHVTGAGDDPVPLVHPGDVRLTVSSPSTGIEWIVPGGDVQVGGTDSADLEVVGRFPIDSLAGGRALPAGTWVPHVVIENAHVFRRLRLPSRKRELGASFVSGRRTVGFADRGKLALDVGALERPMVGNLRGQPVSIVEDARGSRLSIDVPRLELRAGTELTGQLRIGSLPVKAAITVDEGRPVLHAWASGLAGSYPLATKFSRADFAPAGVALQIDGKGGMSIQPVDAPRRRKTPHVTAPSAAGGARARLKQAARGVPGARGLYRRVRTRARRSARVKP